MRSAIDRPWYRTPVAVGFAGMMLIATLGVVFEDRIIPPKPIDPRSNVVQPGGGTFCDPLPTPPPPDGTTMPIR